MRNSDVTMADVADPLVCVFCGGSNLIHADFGWFECHDCTASVRYSQRLGEIVDDEPPENLDVVSELLHKLRNY